MGRKMKIKPNMLAQVITDEMELYHHDVIVVVKKETKKSMKKLVELTKVQSYIQDSGKYRDAITSRNLRETSRLIIMQWYVKPPHHRLSHLLNNGHATRKGGRTVAYKHITIATELVSKEYQDKIAEVLKSG
jgi:hypothetical protein